MPEQFVPSGTVPVPNRLFDEILPDLTDTELRVLLVVVRSTLGWRVHTPNGGWAYKRRDWISHSQLIRRTGRSSAAVSAAVQGLTDKELITVENESGRVLKTPEERRLNIGRLYFGLGLLWKSPRIPVIAEPSSTTDKLNNSSKAVEMWITRHGRRPEPEM